MPSPKATACRAHQSRKRRKLQAEIGPARRSFSEVGGLAQLARASRLQREGQGLSDGCSYKFGCQVKQTGGLAQLARAPDLHSGGQGFDSLILHLCPPKL